MSKAEKIRKMIAGNSNMTNTAIAKACGCTPSYVYMVRKAGAVMQLTDDMIIVDGHAAPQDIDQVLAQRGKRYGDFMTHAEITQALKYEIRRGASFAQMEDDMVEALDMIAHKIGRIVNGDPRYADSWVDIAGYAKLVADRLEGENA